VKDKGVVRFRGALAPRVPVWRASIGSRTFTGRTARCSKPGGLYRGVAFPGVGAAKEAGRSRRGAVPLGTKEEPRGRMAPGFPFESRSDGSQETQILTPHCS